MVRSKRVYQIIPKIASILYIVLFVYAATSKLLDYEQFKIQLGQSPIITAYADIVAWGIPLIEFIIVGLFLFPRFMLFAFYSSYTLMILFTSYIIITLNFSDYIPCSCGGVLEDLGWSEHIIFNLVFITMAIVSVFYLESYQRTIKAILK
tara:strand:+ start:1015 stop:1464 length:450 start_codon:yes stop_codon:yes gene_type:complete